ncbi:MAG: hypothetical protein NC334_04515 [Bacteroides sp.]|nr:hypothetical protein [Bacteroides sp.]
MNVCRIENFNLSFRSNDDILGFDDDESVSRREYIRNYHLNQASPYYSILENSGRLSEYQLQKLMGGLLGRKVDVKSMTKLLPEQKESSATDYDLMKNLPLANVKLIPTVQSYRGSTPAGNLSALPLLKEAGIKHIVDLHGYDNLAKACEENEIDYLFFYVTENMDEDDIFMTKEQFARKTKGMYNSAILSPSLIQHYTDAAVLRWQRRLDESLDKFVRFIQTMRKEDVYIGCEYGTSRTNNALLLNHFFNPKADRTPNCVTKFNYGLLFSIESLYKNLTDSHKAQMGWTEEFDKNFLTRLKKVRGEFKF